MNNSSSILQPTNLLHAFQFGLQGLHYAIRAAIAKCHLSHMLRRKGKPFRDPPENAGEATCLFECADDGVRIHGVEALQNYESETIPISISSSTNIFPPKHAATLPRWATRIIDLRKTLGLSQVEFAKKAQSKQSVVSKWEKGAHRPSPDAFAKLAGIAPDVDKFYFLEEAGIPKEFFLGSADQKLTQQMMSAAGEVVTQAFYSSQSYAKEHEKVEAQLVPLLSDPMAAGNPLTINERDIKGMVPMLRSWLPKTGQIYAVRVEGDSMEPTLGDGYIAFIDVSVQDPQKLIGHMVAARIGDGSTIKWLRFNNKHYTLVPQNSSLRHEVRVMNEGDDWSVIGEVVKWIGEPPPSKRK